MKKKAMGILSYLWVAAVALLLAANYHIFIVQNHFAPAGLNGIATMVQYKTGFSISYITLLINVPLCAAAYFLISRQFAAKTLTFSLVYSVAYLAFQHSGTDYIQYNAQGHDTIFPVIISGVISGLVYGICVHNSASTGGTDVISRYINKVRPQANFFVVVFTLNAVVAVASLFVYSEAGAPDYKPVALCITYCFVSNFVGNYIIKGTKTAYKFTVVTTHAAEISEEITEKLRHTATRMEAVGTYSNEEKSVLICVVNKHQLVDFKNIIAKYPDTFACCETANETYGNFKHIK